MLSQESEEETAETLLKTSATLSDYHVINSIVHFWETTDMEENHKEAISSFLV